MKKNLFAVLMSLCMVAFGLNAQNVKVSGTVSDANGPLPGAVVMVKGTTNGTATDLDGKYQISAGKDAVLEVSCLGYVSTEVAVAGRSVIDVTLSEDSETLEDVIVLGYGTATKKKDLSASVGIVAAPEQLAKRPVTSTQAMLQGQIPGVVVQNTSGSPTSSPSVVIRGQGSPNGDGVLWVVDGVPGAPINSMADIESIVVLKDAASAAIYGAQSGAGGVILVTTKKGTKGVNVSYDGLVGIHHATNVVQSLNAQEEIEMRTRSSAAAGITLDKGWDTSINPWVGTTRTNWVDYIFRNALYHRHNVVLNSGTDKFKNRISFNFSNDDGVLLNTFNRSIGVAYRGEYQVCKWVKVSEDFRWGTGRSRSTDTSSGYSGTIISAIYMPQSAEVYQSYLLEQGQKVYGGTTTEDPAYIAKYGSNFSELHGDVYNPVRLLEATNQWNMSSNMFTTTSLEVGNLVKGLKFTSRFTYYQNQSIAKSFEPQRLEVGKPDTKNTLSESASASWGWKTENSLTYDRTFGKHSVGLLAATTADYASGRGFSMSASTFEDESENLQYFAYAGTYGIPSDYLSGPDANVAIIARGSYSYADRYFLTASWRRDYAGRLAEGHNYGDFPAVTGAWKISSEPFFNAPAVSLLKLRASFGRVGNINSIGWNYKSPTLSSSGWANQSAQYGLPTDEGRTGTFYYNGKALNPNLTWETSEQINLGLDMGFLRDRLNASVDVYRKRTYNLIQSQSSGWPDSIGASAMLVNLGEVCNKGIEFTLGWHDTKGDWSYYVNANAGYNKNWVSDIGVADDSGNKGVWTGGGGFRAVPYIYQTAEGQPLNSFYMIKCLGIFQSMEDVYDHQKDGKLIQPNAQPGDLKFEDYNGDGQISSADRQYMGNSVPDWTYSFNFGFTWKNLSIDAQLYGVLGAQTAYMGKYSLLSDVEGNFNRSKEILNAWTETNRTSNIPRLSRNDPNGNFTTASSWYLEDSSFLRLKNVTVSYDFTKLVRRMSYFNERNSALSVYFSGENLFTITDYSGMDPECGGWDGVNYPLSMVLSFGVKLTF